jgi:hypothetical protein
MPLASRVGSSGRWDERDKPVNARASCLRASSSFIAHKVNLKNDIAYRAVVR